MVSFREIYWQAHTVYSTSIISKVIFVVAINWHSDIPVSNLSAQFMDLDSMRRDIKDICFNANLRNFKVVNLGRVVEERSENWGTDPVHMLPDCYSKLAGLLMEEAKRIMETSTKPIKIKPSAVERASKRQANNSPRREEKKNRFQQRSYQSHGGQGPSDSAWHWRSNQGRRGGWRPRRGGYQGRRGW